MYEAAAPDVPTYHLFTQPSDPKVAAERGKPWRGDEFSFRDLLDVINPLQHLPIIGTIYRKLTGDDIGAVPRIIGDGLFGGPIGLVAGLFNATLKQESGKDAGEQVLAMVSGDDAAPGADPPTETLASAASPGKVTVGTPTVETAAPDAGAPVAPFSVARGNSLAAAARPGTGSLFAARPAAVEAASAATPAAATVSPPAAPAPGPEVAAPQAAAVQTAAAQNAAAQNAAGDPRGPFFARLEQMRRQSGSPLQNRVVPLDGVAAPLAQRPRVQTAAYTGPATAGPGAAQAAAPAAAAPAALPSNPPVDISQQMMDALDKYARMQQQRAGRGQQVDVAQ